MDKTKIDEAKTKLKSARDTVLPKVKSAISDIKTNFRSDEGTTGFVKTKSMFVNLWKSGQNGRVALVASTVAIAIVVVVGSLFCCSEDDDADILGNVVANMVTIIPGKNYMMSKYEVTQAQWEYVMGDCQSLNRGKNRPVEMVTWDQCQMFIKKLNALPEVVEQCLVFRLPKDFEWEYACRAGATGRFCKLADGTEITDETLGDVAWYKGNSGDKTHPVGQKKPNALGLYDMLGNVAEWTETIANGDKRIYCGGNFLSDTDWCTTTDRPSRSSGSNSTIGFRLCAIRTKPLTNSGAILPSGTIKPMVD